MTFAPEPPPRIADLAGKQQQELGAVPTDPTWHHRAGWATAHVLRPGVRTVFRGQEYARTLCGRDVLVDVAAPGIGSAVKCGQCVRRVRSGSYG